MLRRYPLAQCSLALLTCAALILSIGACDTVGSLGGSEEDPDVELGRFVLTIDGAVADTLEGQAAFTTTTFTDSTGTEHPGFVLSFSPDTADAGEPTHSWFSSQIMRMSERPETGDYEFAHYELQMGESGLPEEEFAFTLQTEDTTRTVVVASEEGSLTFTSSASARLAGTFTVEASGLAYTYSESDGPQQGTVTVEGEFNAIGGEAPTDE